MFSVFHDLKLPKVLLETGSPHNKKIILVEAGKTRKVLVEGTIQSVNWDSPIVEKKFWGHIVPILKEYQPTLSNVLMLGLGGGTMQHLISHAFPEINITTVEIDKVMVDLATEYFDLAKIPNHTIIIDDAFRFVAEPDKRGFSDHSFQAAVVDLACGETYSDLNKSGTFITSLKNLVVPEGLIIFNRMYLEHHQESVNEFIKVASEYLADVKTEIIAGATNSDNILIYGRA